MNLRKRFLCTLPGLALSAGHFWMFGFMTTACGALAAPLQQPVDLVAIPDSPTSMHLTWRDVASGEAGFRVERRVLQGDWVTAGTVPPDANQYISVGLYANTHYEHRVIAHRGEEETASAVAAGLTLPLLNQRRGAIIETASARQGEGTFLKLTSGELVLYYSDMLTTSDMAESRVVRKVSPDGGHTWGEREVVFSEPGMALFLPSVMRLDSGEIALSYARRVPGQWESQRVVRISSDEGRTWSGEIPVSDGAYGYMTGSHDRFYRLSNGDLMILIHSLKDDRDKVRHLVTDVYGSTDQARTWTRWTRESLDAPLNPFGSHEFGFWECAIAELDDGELFMLGRTATGWAYQSRSSDFGRTWQEPRRSHLTNPLAPPYLKKIPGSKELLLISTPMVDPKRRLFGDRYALMSRISSDGGATWRNGKVIEYHSEDWWYDYPHVLFDGPFLHLSCRSIELSQEKRWDKVNLGYLKLPLSWLTE